MKNLLILFATLATIICGTSSCKKCFTCVIDNKCGKCAAMPGVVHCSADSKTTYDTAKTVCEGGGSTWTVTSSTNNSTEYCDEASESLCVSAGGVWSSK